MTKQIDTSFLAGANAPFIEELYAKFATDPGSVDAEWAAFFAELRDEAPGVLKALEGASWSPRAARVIGNGQPDAAPDKPANGVPAAPASTDAAATAALLSVGLNTANAEKTLKLGTVSPTTVPLGQSLEEGLIANVAEISGGKLKIDGHFQGSLCSEQKCGEQANQGLLAIWTSSTANFGNFGTALAVFDLPFIFKDQDAADKISDEWLGDAQCEVAAKTTSWSSGITPITSYV